MCIFSVEQTLSSADARTVRPYVPTDVDILHDTKLKCTNIVYIGLDCKLLHSLLNQVQFASVSRSQPLMSPGTDGIFKFIIYHTNIILDCLILHETTPYDCLILHKISSSGGPRALMRVSGNFF